MKFKIEDFGWSAEEELRASAAAAIANEKIDEYLTELTEAYYLLNEIRIKAWKHDFEDRVRKWLEKYENSKRPG